MFRLYIYFNIDYRDIFRAREMPQGSVTSLTLLTVFLVGCCTCQVIESIDTIEPIVKISPDRNNTEDRFGISVTAHRLYDVASDDSLQEALNKTV